jgi:hypothetical protein
MKICVLGEQEFRLLFSTLNQPRKLCLSRLVIRRNPIGSVKRNEGENRESSDLRYTNSSNGTEDRALQGGKANEQNEARLVRAETIVQVSER